MYVSHIRLAFFALLHLPLKHDINSAMYVSHIRLAFFALLHLPLKHDINSAMYGEPHSFDLLRPLAPSTKA